MSLELDTQTPEQQRAAIIRSCGANPIGERPGPGKGEQLCWFTDPITKTTLLLPIDEVTEDIVREKLSAARQKFAMALLDIATSGKNIDLKNRLQYILDFLLQAKNLPAAKIEEAAIAALAIIATPEPAAKILQFEDRPGAYHPDTSDLDRTNPPQGSAA